MIKVAFEELEKNIPFILKHIEAGDSFLILKGADTMNLDTLKETIRQELPELLRMDPDFRSCILEMTRSEYAGRQETRAINA
jgi:hypothetical protein